MLMKRKNILVAVSGMSPQIITETLFGLSQGSWLPDEIHLITTASGQERARLLLLESKKQIDAFVKEYSIQHKIEFSLQNIHVISGENGKALCDLRTPIENEIAADFITETIRSFTADKNTELHVSLSGGRKTMGFYIGYALSIFGRPQDKLSHVLVSPEYESIPEFFYPTQQTHVIYSRDKQGKSIPLDSSKAEVWLSEIPFVRLRSFLPDDALCNTAKFSDVVALVEMATQPILVSIDIAKRSIRVNNTACKFSPSLFAFYLWFARQIGNRQSKIIIPVTGEYRKDYRDAFAKLLYEIKGVSAGTEKTINETLKEGMNKEFFEQTLAKLKRQIKDSFGPEMANKIGIIRVENDGQWAYQIPLTSEQLIITG
jgi:CRISPR-associated protein (TIGR02584 family)